MPPYAGYGIECGTSLVKSSKVDGLTITVNGNQVSNNFSLELISTHYVAGGKGLSLHVSNTQY